MNDDDLTIKQAAAVLKISPVTIRRKIKSGAVQTKMRKGKYGREYVIPRHELQKLQTEEKIYLPPSIDQLVQQAVKDIFVEVVDEIKIYLKDLITEKPSNLSDNDKGIMDKIDALQIQINKLEISLLRELGVQGTESLKDKNEIKIEMDKISKKLDKILLNLKM